MNHRVLKGIIMGIEYPEQRTTHFNNNEHSSGETTNNTSPNVNTESQEGNYCIKHG